jgi:uncharacterized protein YjbI with pentapeptide repeats
MATDLDPFDLEALERSLNDSAVRVSTIWVSFLVFGLYLAIAAGGVTPLQLFLVGAGKVKLPLLYTDLTVFSFFLVAPVLFVIFHLYLLIQVVLLRRTADAYNEAVDRNIAVASDRAHIRQRLANTLFAQLFAGSPREREGLLGMLLRLMASTTLAILPVLLLLLFQIWFLPYQSGFVTLTHRLLILVDLMMVLILWHGAFEPRRDIVWRLLRVRRVPMLCASALVLFSWFMVHFPGELHASWMRFGPGGCGGFIFSDLAYFFSDRLSPSLLDMAQDERLAKIEAAAKAEPQVAYQNEIITYDFQYRNFRCAKLRRVNFRRADFTGANFQGADLSDANLQGAVLRGANLWAADLARAQMQGADLGQERERRVTYYLWYSGAELRGANLSGAQLQGARLDSTIAAGAYLSGAQMQGASLSFASFNGADLSGAQMQGANLYHAHLMGTNLTSAKLDGANLVEVYLQGALLDRASFNLAEIWHSYLWRTKGAKCDGAQVSEPQFDPTNKKDIDNVVRWLSKSAEEEVRKRFVVDAEHDDTAKDVWLVCESKALTRSDYERQHAAYLVGLICSHPDQHVRFGIYANWVEREPVDPLSGVPEVLGPEFMIKRLSGDVRLQAIIRGLLHRDDNACPGASVFDERVIKRLQELKRSEL